MANDFLPGTASTFGDLHQRLLEEYAPPSLVVNELYEIVHLTERALHYLLPAGQEPAENLLNRIRQEWRNEMQLTLDQAVKHHLPMVSDPIQIQDAETITIEVRPAFHDDDPARFFLLVLFRPYVVAPEVMQLRESEERLRATVEAARDFAIITTNVQGIIQGWNTGAERIFGYTQQEAIGKPGHIIFTPEDIAAGVPEKEMEETRTEGRAIDERWHQRKDGSRFFVSGVMAPILNATLHGYVKVARDITSRKILEQQKDEFIGIASHELKTPVTSIKAYGEVLREMFEESRDDNSARVMEKLNMQIDRLINLIRVLLDATSLAEGQFKLHKEMFDLNALIAERVEDLRIISGNHPILFTFNESMPVMADKERLAIVLNNLISNAIKYSNDGGEVAITSISHAGGFTVRIRDRGVGIPRELKDRIFERFFRVNNSDVSGTAGIGLGLYITAEIIRYHNGTITVQSSPGEGSEFSFTIPHNQTQYNGDHG